MDAFKRKKSELNWEIYHPNQIESINSAIRRVSELFTQYNVPQMPSYYKEGAKEQSHQSL